MFSEPVYVTDSIGVSQIAKHTSCNEVIVRIKLLALKTPCIEYTFEVPFNINYNE